MLRVSVRCGATAVYPERMRRMRAGGALLVSASLVVGAFLAVVPAAGAAAPELGKRCKVLGQEAVDAQGRTLVCKKNRKGMRVWMLKKPAPTPPPSQPTGPPYQWSGTWADGWMKVGSPPPCPTDLSTLFTRLPFDIDDVPSIVRPGYLNPHSGYKPHGHVRFMPPELAGQPDAVVKSRQVIYAPADGWVYAAGLYREAYTPGNDQVILDFFTECGVMWRFDHLRQGHLSPVLAEAIKAVPMREDTQTKFITPVRVKAGDVIATAVGITSCDVAVAVGCPGPGPNLFVDFGVYDPRQLNEAARSDPSFLTGPNVGSYKGIGLCWIDLFPASKAAIEAKAEGESDYC